MIAGLPIRLRTVIALFAAPILAAALVAITLPLWALRTPDMAVDWQHDTEGVVFVFLALLIVGLPATATFGALVHTFFYRPGIHGLGPYVAAGAIASALISLVFTGGDLVSLFTASLLAVAVPCGVLTAIFAWLIRRPDRDQPAASSNDTSA